jgi:formate dehydrogenase maturation protein FdhE
MGIAKDAADLINDMLADQPYAVKCQECGQDLSFETALDNDGDMIVDVETCDSCIADSYANGIKDGKETE